MVVTVVNPVGERNTVPTDGRVLCVATATPPDVAANILWAVSINGGAFNTFAAGAQAVYTTPSSVTNANVAGSKATDKVELRASQITTDICTLLLVQGPPFINHTNVLGTVTSGVPTPATTPQDRVLNGGPVDPRFPTQGSPVDQSNEPEAGSGSVPGCVSLQPPSMLLDERPTSNQPNSTGCGCLSQDTFDGGHLASKGLEGGQGPEVNSPGGGNAAGIAKSAPMWCASTEQARGSQAWVRPYGQLQFKSGCGALVTRGKTLELCTWFSNVPDPLASAERIAGLKTSFGWQSRLIQDTAGNVAIYWGNRSIEAWLTNDGGSTFLAPAGVFGTLTKSGGGAFTRTTKDSTYYDFDSNGRLQSIKDRSADGNPIYFNYNGSNQPIRITGPGLGYKPYFTYDGNGRVNAMNLEGAAPWPERTTYFDYDASGRMNKAIWPEACISYFDYDGNDNLSLEINPDNYRTYFTYGAQTIPRIREINMPVNAAVYFTYNDAVPRFTATQADGPSRVHDYQWAGLPQVLSENSEVAYFEYEGNAKPTYSRGVDGNLTYYVWDASGQMTSQKNCEDTTQAFTYGPHGRITSWQNEEGATTYWNYDAGGYQTNWIDRAGNTTYFERDTYGKILSEKDRRGNAAYFEYSSQGLVVLRKAADATVRYFEWSAAAEIESIKDELGNVAYYHHDKRGRILLWKDFLAQVSEYGYDGRSNLTVMLDRRANAWYFEYDGLSRRHAARTALLNTSYFNYSRINVLSSQVDPRGNPAYFYYTAEKRLLARENALQERTYFSYTPAGLIESVKDPRGNAQYFTYDCHNRRTSMQDGVGNVTYFRYDPDGDNSATTDPRGNTTYLYYDVMDRMFARRNALNEVSYFYFDAEGNPTCTEDALARRTYFYFDAVGRRFCVEDAQKNLTYYTFEARDPVSSMKNARGFVTYMYYDALERQFAARDARDGVTYIEYDPNSNRLSSRDARGNTSYFHLDADNRNILAKTPLGEMTYLEYDAAANRTSVKDARGNSSYFYFDTLNRLFCSEDAKQARSYFTFDAAGNTSSQKDPLARVTYHDFDADNRRFVTIDATAGTRYFTFDAASNNDSVKNPRGFVTYMTYDQLNRLAWQRSPVGGLTYFAFDTVGNRFSVKDPLGRTNYFYFDSLNRQIASEDGLQRRTYFEFDVVGNTVSIKNPRRATVSPAEVGIQYFTYDALNRRNSAKDEVAESWYYDYDAASNLQSQINPRVALTYWEYDTLNRKQSQKDPLARAWYWTYDAVGNVKSVKDGKAAVTDYDFDPVNLLDRVDYPDGNHDYFEYDLARQRTAAVDSTGGTYWLYDDLGRVTTRKTPWFGTSAYSTEQSQYYEYDADGNRITLKDQDGKTIYYDWDEADRMKEVHSADYGGWLCYYEYNAADQRVHARRMNNTTTYHGYDAAGRISQIQHRRLTTTFEKLDFTRDEAGNPIQIVLDTGAANTLSTYFNYDPANRITKEDWRTSVGANPYGFLYTYDSAGNRTIKKHTAPSTAAQYWEYDLGDQLQKQRDGGTVGVYFSFDDNGNLSLEHNASPSGRTYYDYDPRNLLARVDFPAGGPQTNYFYYNSIGERIRKDDSTGGKVYTWDGIDVVVEKNRASGASSNRYLKGYTPIPGIGAHLMLDPGAGGTTYFTHDDQVGSTRRVTNHTGAVANTYRSDAWGQPFVTSEAAGVGYQYRFNGKELDPDFVLFNSNNRRYHYPARTYVPFRGLFTQADPLSHIKWMNKRSGQTIRVLKATYSLVLPLVSTDPLGLIATHADCTHAIMDLERTQAIDIEAMKEEHAKYATSPPWERDTCDFSISCTCCDPVGAPPTQPLGYLGVTDSDSRVIICLNRHSGYTDLLESVRHEFVHAFDHCFAKSWDCDDAACTEIRAAFFSRECDGGTSQLAGESNLDCVRRVAEDSMRAKTKDCGDPGAMIGHVWDQCLLAGPNDHALIPAMWWARPH